MTNPTDLHPQQPHWVYAVIEQPRDEPMRLQFNPQSGQFERTQWPALSFLRQFPGHYGWIQGTGQPPGLHYDVYVVDDQPAELGDVREAAVIGMFQRADGDHKFLAMVGVPFGQEPDLLGLPDAQRLAVQALYPRVDAGDAWLGRDDAREWLRTRPPEHD